MQKKKGISLIVLVITIIVMIILAGAIIISLNNTGVIKKASEAVETTDEATVKELAQIAWAEAYASGIREVEGENGLKAKVTSTLQANGINTENIGKYLINVTAKGVTVKPIAEAWIQRGHIVVRGSEELKIGDLVGYDETAGETKTDLTATEWQVLGADEDGNLLILSTEYIATKLLGDKDDLNKTQQDWLNGPKLLDAECKAYGYGEGAVGTPRSITVEDVNKITGYNPETADRGDSYLFNYGSNVTYAWVGDKISYRVVENNVERSYSFNYEYPSFTWYDEKTNTFPSVPKGDMTKPLPTFKETAYWYNATKTTDNVKAYDMIFGTGNNDKFYWLASHYRRLSSEHVNFGMYRVEEGTSVVGYFMWDSMGTSIEEYNWNVRAVVTLSSDLQFKGSSEAGWNY